MSESRGLTGRQRAVKRVLDLAIAVPVLVLTAPMIVGACLAARLATGQSGIFRQVRIGRDGQPFEVCKIRTMRAVEGVDTNVTTGHDVRITRSRCVDAPVEDRRAPPAAQRHPGRHEPGGSASGRTRLRRPALGGRSRRAVGTPRHHRPGHVGVPGRGAAAHHGGRPRVAQPHRAVAGEGGAQPGVRRELVRWRRRPSTWCTRCAGGPDGRTRAALALRRRRAGGRAGPGGDALGLGGAGRPAPRAVRGGVGRAHGSIPRRGAELRDRGPAPVAAGHRRTRGRRGDRAHADLRGNGQRRRLHRCRAVLRGRRPADRQPGPRPAAAGDRAAAGRGSPGDRGHPGGHVRGLCRLRHPAAAGRRARAGRRRGRGRGSRIVAPARPGREVRHRRGAVVQRQQDHDDQRRRSLRHRRRRTRRPGPLPEHPGPRAGRPLRAPRDRLQLPAEQHPRGHRHRPAGAPGRHDRPAPRHPRPRTEISLSTSAACGCSATPAPHRTTAG